MIGILTSKRAFGSKYAPCPHPRFHVAVYALALPITLLAAGKGKAADYSRVICESGAPAPSLTAAHRRPLAHRVHHDPLVGGDAPSPTHAVPVRKHATVRSGQALMTVCHSIPVRPIGGTYGGIRGFGYFFSANGTIGTTHFGGPASYPGSPAGGGPSAFGGAPGLVSGGYSPVPGNVSDIPPQIQPSSNTRPPTNIDLPSGIETEVPPPQIALAPNFPDIPPTFSTQLPNQPIIDMPLAGTPPLGLPPELDVPPRVPSPVPEPPALWLFVIGSLGVLYLRGRDSATLT